MSKQIELFDQVVENVRDKLLQRSQVGIKKYGTTLHQNNVDNYFNHLQQELLDAANYCEKELMKRQDIQSLIKLYPNDAELGKAIRKVYTENIE